MEAERKANGTEMIAPHNRTQKCDADGLQQQIRHTLGSEIEQQVRIRVEDARQDIPGNHRSILRGARRLHGRAAPDQQSYDHYSHGQLKDPAAGPLFISRFDSFVHGSSSYTSRFRAARLMVSMINTVTNSASRIMPTLAYSRQPIFSFRIRPRPPAPTYPRMEA